MDLSHVDPVALSQALDDPDPDREHFLELKTGSLWTFVFSEATDETRKRHDEVTAESEDGWLRIPSMTLQEAYEESEDFVDGLPEGEVQESLYTALERKRALRNFREAIMQLPEERQLWTAYRKERSKGRLDRFLASLDRSGTEAGALS